MKFSFAKMAKKAIIRSLPVGAGSGAVSAGLGGSPDQAAVVGAIVTLISFAWNAGQNWWKNRDK